MKKTMFTTFGSLLLVSGLLFSATAQVRSGKQQVTMTKAKMPTIIKCMPQGSSDVATQVQIENNTKAALPKGTKINWSTNAGIKGSVVLTNPLAVGGKISGLTPTPSNSTACTAAF